MNDKLDVLLAKIKVLEGELVTEIRTGREKFGYEIKKGQVHFKQVVVQGHLKIKKSLYRYFCDAKFLTILTAPVIWSCLIPVLLLDAVAGFYQFVCFPIYKIPQVLRRDYIIIDRHHLRYLNTMEKLNCAYCGYVNGVIAYVQEIAGRTEQYWCPIKHAMSLKTRHSRYQHFVDYGDAEQYRKRIEEIRREFGDVKKS